MKKLKLIILSASILLFSNYTFAQKGCDNPKGYFSYHQVEDDVSSTSQFSSTISYNGDIYNFIYYSASARSKIVVRKMSQKSNASYGTIRLAQEKMGNGNLDVSNRYFQPAPVVYFGKLYLFLQNKDDRLSYSVLNDDGTWSAQKTYGEGGAKMVKNGMAAVVLDEKICVFFKKYDESGVSCIWSEDKTLENWNTENLNFKIGGDKDERFGSLSAITTTVVENGNVKQIALLGYVNSGHDAYCRKYEFNTGGKFVQWGDTQLIDKNFEYNCVTLVEGNVNEDIGSSGKCVQAFVKRDNKDNGYCRYRILRLQCKAIRKTYEKWEMRENNLVKQNYGWGDKQVNLSVAKLAIAEYEGSDTSSFRQYMCLIYRGYDDQTHPLLCAWAETDKAVHQESIEFTLTDPAHIRYIGCVEGPPPFYINRDSASLAGNFYKNINGGSISELEFDASSVNKSSTDYSLKLGIEQSMEYKGFKEELSAGWGKTHEIAKETTIHNVFTFEASEKNKPTYIVIQPTVHRDHYHIIDNKNAVVDSAYFFCISKTTMTTIDGEAPLKNGLIPSDPTTYKNNIARNFSNYSDDEYHFNPKTGNEISVTWADGQVGKTAFEIKDEETNSNSFDVSLKLGFENKFGKDKENKFSVGVSGSFDYKWTTTEISTTGFGVTTKLNEPQAGLQHQVNRLQYNVHWIKPNPDANNWWMPEDAPDQKDLWCITYEVTDMDTVGQGKAPDGLINTPGTVITIIQRRH